MLHLKWGYVPINPLKVENAFNTPTEQCKLAFSTLNALRTLKILAFSWAKSSCCHCLPSQERIARP